MQSTKIDLVFLKCEAVPNISQESTSANIWQINMDYWAIITINMTLFCGDEKWIHHYAPERRHHSLKRKHPTSPSKRKLKTQPLAGTLTKEGFIVKCFGTHWNHLFKQNAGDYYRNLSQNCTIIPFRTLHPMLLKISAIWTLRCWSTFLTAVNWFFLTHHLVHSNTFWEASISPVTKGGSNCACVECHCIKNFFMRAYRSFCELSYVCLKGQSLYRENDANMHIHYTYYLI